MSGLYRKALDFLQANSQLRLVTKDEIEADQQQISHEDNETITAQIEEMLEANRLRIDDDAFTVDAERKGGVLPFFVNLVAVLLVAGGFFAALYYFDRKEQEVSAGRQSIVSAESRLLDTMAAESEQRLSEKDNEISSIQRQLATIISERQSIKTSADEAIQQREEELAAELQLQIDAERARLREGGLTAEAVTERMNSFQAELQRSFDAQIAEVISQSNRELEERENSLNALISEYEQTLQGAEIERAELVENLEARRTELEDQLAASESARAGERDRFDQQLRTMRAQQEQEQLVLDQLLALYASIEADISGGSLEAAQGKIAELRSYLDDFELAQLPVMQTRRSVELFLVESLDSLVNRELTDREIDTQSLIQSANSISSAIALVEEGNGFVDRGDFEGAREKYLAAFGKIPALLDGYNGVTTIDAQLRQVKAIQINEIVKNADSRFRAGEYQEALNLYTRAVTQVADEGTLDPLMVTQISEAGYRLQRSADLTELAQVRNQLAEALDRETSLSESVQVQTAEIERQTQLLSDQVALREDLAKEQDADIAALEETYAARSAELLAEIGRVRSELDLAEREIERLLVVEARDERRTRIARFVRDYGNKYSAALTFTLPGSEPATDSSGVLSLLETKLALVTILNSDSVREEYPGIAEKVNLYLEGLIEQNTAEIQIATLLEMNELADLLLEGSAEETPEVYTGNEQARLYAVFIQKLALLLR